jgi:hypothetical protein
MNQYLEINSGEHKYPYFFGVFSIRKFGQKHPSHPITSLADDTPMDVLIDLVIIGIEGGYKFKGQQMPEEILHRLENQTPIEDYGKMISQIFQSEKNDPKPKAKG